jgi:4-hydroxyacetophenone monooxygenase
VTRVDESNASPASAMDALGVADARSLAATIAYLTEDEAPEIDPRDRAALTALAERELPRFVGKSLADLGERSTETLRRCMALAGGQSVPDDYEALVRSYFRLSPSTSASRHEPTRSSDLTVTIIGGGVTGILVAHSLEEAGFSNFQILEKRPEPGGVWWQNRYPGCRVDTPSLIYSYSFDPDPGWHDHFSYQPDVLGYVKRHAARFADRIRTGVEVRSLSWDEAASEWNVECWSEHEQRVVTIRSNFVVGATGVLHIPRIPDIRGASTFTGRSFHSSRWDESVDLAGKRVAVIGAGASANQIVPAIAGTASDVLVYQRTPHWIVAHPQYGARLVGAERYLVEAIPSYAEWYRFRQFWTLGDAALESIKIDPNWPHLDRSANAANDRLRAKLVAYIESRLGHRPELLELVTPSYPPYTKRMLLDNGWYDALGRDDVRLVTAPICFIDATGIGTEAGHEAVDVIVYATGFHTDKYLGDMPIVGTGGSDIRANLDRTGESYLGVLLPNAPNFFLTWGPYSVPGHGGSGMFISECQANYIVECVRLVAATGSHQLLVNDSSVAAFMAAMAESVKGLVWTLSDESSWYRRSDGRVAVLPRRLLDLWEDTRRVDDQTVTLR